jgi:hypothetical protein
MATRTQHYNLIKPGSGDYYDIGDFNANADAVDSAIRSVSNTAAAAQSTAQAAASSVAALTAQNPAEPGFVPDTPWIQLVRTNDIAVFYKGSGNMVHVQIYVANQGLGGIIATLPEGFRPRTPVQTGSSFFLGSLRFATAVTGTGTSGYTVGANGTITRDGGWSTCFSFSVIN